MMCSLFQAIIDKLMEENQSKDKMIADLMLRDQSPMYQNFMNKVVALQTKYVCVFEGSCRDRQERVLRCLI